MAEKVVRKDVGELTDLGMLKRLVEAAKFAASKGYSPDVVRSATRSGALPSYSFFGKVLVDPEDAAVQAWEPGEGRGHVVREDGRQPYTVAAHKDEWNKLVALGLSIGMPTDCFTDPREVRKAKREAEPPERKPRKAKTAAAATDAGLDTSEENPFKAFGV
jgi:hypothetical protein